tara:strand:+ start:4534 stop:4899 length:366 start_codon:yes stop_codon:yes gene_type:complete
MATNEKSASVRVIEYTPPTYDLTDWNRDPVRVRMVVSAYAGFVTTFFLAAVCCVTIYLGFRNGSIDCTRDGKQGWFVWVIAIALILQISGTMWNAVEMAQFQGRKCLVPVEELQAKKPKGV